MANRISDDLYARIQEQKLRIIDQSRGEINLSGIGVIKTSIKLSSKMLLNTLENGFTNADSRVITPAKVSIEIVTTSIDAIERINKAIQSRNSLFTVVSRGLTVDNLMILNDSIDQNADILDGSPITINMSRVLFEKDDIEPFARAADSTITDRGLYFISQIQTPVGELISKVGLNG